jgi:hypothetical protein
VEVSIWGWIFLLHAVTCINPIEFGHTTNNSSYNTDRGTLANLPIPAAQFRIFQSTYEPFQLGHPAILSFFVVVFFASTAIATFSESSVRIATPSCCCGFFTALSLPFLYWVERTVCKLPIITTRGWWWQRVVPRNEIVWNRK